MSYLDEWKYAVYIKARVEYKHNSKIKTPSYKQKRSKNIAAVAATKTTFKFKSLL